MSDWTGKHVVITGGASGIGAATAELLRANGAALTVIDTPILKDFEHALGERARRGRQITGRAGRPEEIARVIAFLAAPDASWVTGCDVECDGGLTAQIDVDLLDLPRKTL